MPDSDALFTSTSEHSERAGEHGDDADGAAELSHLLAKSSVMGLCFFPAAMLSAVRPSASR